MTMITMMIGGHQEEMKDKGGSLGLTTGPGMSTNPQSQNGNQKGGIHEAELNEKHFFNLETRMRISSIHLYFILFLFIFYESSCDITQV